MILKLTYLCKSDSYIIAVCLSARVFEAQTNVSRKIFPSVMTKLLSFDEDQGCSGNTMTVSKFGYIYVEYKLKLQL